MADYKRASSMHDAGKAKRSDGGKADACPPRLLVVDDEPDIVDMLVAYFQLSGMEVVGAHNAAEALARAGDDIYLALLDINMPGMDGLELCRRLRERLTCPIIFLTARVEDADQLEGFSAGADDYVLKPFSLEVLGARVRAHLARGTRIGASRTVRAFGPVRIDYAQRSVTVMASGAAPAEVQLTRTEFDIVALLSKNPGQVFDRQRIYEEVWGWDAAGDASSVTEHIRRTRKKLTAAGAPENAVETVWGVGYKWGLQR